MSSQISRDPDDYVMTEHGRIRMKERNIGWHEINLAIEDGELLANPPDSGEDTPVAEDWGMRLDLPGPDLMVIGGNNHPDGVLKAGEHAVVTTWWETFDEGRGGGL